MFTPDEINLLREWFDALSDVSPAYLEEKDWALADKIADMLGIKHPHRPPTSAQPL